MAKSHETPGKKDKEKKRLKQRQKKEEKMAERKANAQKGKSLNEMMAYIDENGNISSTPPDPNKKKTVHHSEIQVSVPRLEDRPRYEITRRGTVTFFNHNKGFGFIKDSETAESIFVHVSQLAEPLMENDLVIFELGSGPRGPSATNVKKAVSGK